MNNLITIPFHNQTITAINHHGKPYIAMRPIVENLGLDWKSQHVKINDKFNRVVVIITTTGQDEKQYKMLCLPVSKIAAFLYSINASKVKPELRQTIIDYQEHCDEVLFNHFVTEKNTQLNALISPLFTKHPQWQETRDLYVYGFSTREMAKLQDKHQRNVQRMLARIKQAGIFCQRKTLTALAA